jgi:UDP-N-acetylglucosamine 2-epimerase (non-hydrolysing)
LYKSTIACVVGARPNFMKIAPILAELERQGNFQPCLIHTGQHSSPEMSAAFFRDLEIREPDISLGISGGSSNEQAARVMLALEPLFTTSRPDLVLVVGDVNATAAAALVAAKMNLPLAHVEAGLRSFDRTMPEEINRIVTDSLSQFVCTTEPGAAANLRREGIPRERIYFCGNVMIDTLLRFRERAAGSPIVADLGLERGRYALVTLHRPSNVDDADKLRELLGMLDCLAERIPVIFPVHPRTRNSMAVHGIEARRVRLISPQSYIDFLALMSSARLVLTDSGGIQEETTILGVTCLTLRENTERPVTIEQGTNRLAGTDPRAIFEAAEEALAAPPANPRRPALWDGQAAKRIVETLVRVVGSQRDLACPSLALRQSLITAS